MCMFYRNARLLRQLASFEHILAILLLHSKFSREAVSKRCSFAFPNAKKLNVNCSNILITFARRLLLSQLKQSIVFQLCFSNITVCKCMFSVWYLALLGSNYRTLFPRDFNYNLPSKVSSFFVFKRNYLSLWSAAHMLGWECISVKNELTLQVSTYAFCIQC